MLGWINVHPAMGKCPKPGKSSSKCKIDAKELREEFNLCERKLYLEKLWFIGGVDPYELVGLIMTPRVFLVLHFS